MIDFDQKIEVKMYSNSSLALLAVSLLPELVKVMINICSRGFCGVSVKRQVMLFRDMLMGKGRVL
jgi:hypothetical protein